jgi:hypothetical protein
LLTHTYRVAAGGSPARRSLATEEAVMPANEGRYVVDENGKRVGVVLDIEEYKKLLDDLDELDAIRAFDRAKASGEKPVPLDRAVADIERRRR